jgi:hypothetical protein
MGELYARDHPDRLTPVKVTCDLHNPRDEIIEVGGIGMVGNGHGSVPHSFESSDEFRRDKDAVAEKGVGMQIDHPGSPLINHQAIISCVAILPEAGRRSLLPPGRRSYWPEASRRITLYASVVAPRRLTSDGLPVDQNCPQTD